MPKKTLELHPGNLNDDHVGHCGISGAPPLCARTVDGSPFSAQSPK